MGRGGVQLPEKSIEWPQIKILRRNVISYHTCTYFQPIWMTSRMIACANLSSVPWRLKNVAMRTGSVRFTEPDVTPRCGRPSSRVTSPTSRVAAVDVWVIHATNRLMSPTAAESQSSSLMSAWYSATLDLKKNIKKKGIL